jgi:hypothetical protein
LVEDGVGEGVFEEWGWDGAEEAVVHGVLPLFAYYKTKELFIALEAILKEHCSFMTAQKEPKRRHGTKVPGPPFLFIPVLERLSPSLVS